MTFTIPIRDNEPLGRAQLERFVAAVRAGERPKPEDETSLANAFRDILDGEEPAKALQLKRKTRGRPRNKRGRDYRLARQVYAAKHNEPDALITDIFVLVGEKNFLSKGAIEKVWYERKYQVEAEEQAIAELLRKLRERTNVTARLAKESSAVARLAKESSAVARLASADYRHGPGKN